ncbi:carboxylate--amine ligase/circularly permuted type 2 ATP-grasp protein [Rhodococcus aetherivorans]|uniref:carboxylate--amine ligase/circularly permuted type 2 ATP-grasp protein n=1 Tax=Rhodococcus aetherivorans TaxID=191292 RepID=UPI0002D2159C|nr:carboxylate--amine ligase/circularly permuted type 2 ATP-grasp protein [Rhodococcus aetherivorans]WFS14185.1 carboxylate--amine ligase/circularly permuted type 2 ATP-grasp protein [Rhodococcus aetherivorans]CCW09616.1 glutamate--cysteine ligase, GCS2 family/ probable peptidase [Rhodococcus aetherivorans]
MFGGGARKLGVEEEFHLIDAKTRRLTPRAPELLARLPGDVYVEELQRCVVEVNSGVFPDLAGLRADLVHRRSVLVDTAAELGLGIAAAGAVPLAVPAEMQVTETPRYRRMLADYQLLAREQLICGTQVHVDIPDRDEAVQVANRVAPFLPIFLALSASSPFWADGTDTGYASVRNLVWIRWPSTGPAAPVSSAAEYDKLIADLVSTGVITDPGMVYFDLRPSDRYPTLELRVCDSCPSVDTITLIAGLFRALVDREVTDLRAGVPGLDVSPTLVRAAMWRASRSGLEGPLVDVQSATPRPAREIVDGLIRSLRPQLEGNDDWALVSELAETALQVGSSAARQRRVLRRRGRLTDVVDLLLDETAGRVRAVPEIADPGATLLHGYVPLRAGDVDDRYDEAVEVGGRPRREYEAVLAAVARVGAAELRRIQESIDREQSVDGVTFRVSGEDRAQVFPMDIVPRIVPHTEWAHLVPGLQQRALALNAFLGDIYGEQAAVRDGVIPSELLDRAPGYRATGAAAANPPVRAHICGIDLVSTGPGDFVVLEDNLRVPSGVGYAMAHRAMTTRFLGALGMPADVMSVDSMPEMTRQTLQAAAPAAAAGPDVSVALLSAGWKDSAWFEHRLLAEKSGLPLVLTGELSVRDDVVYRHRGREATRVDVLYVRLDEDMLLSSIGHDGHPLRRGLRAALQAGNVTIANALGNGVGDDKAVYSYVPAMIEYYLGEKPILEQVPTWVCAEREQRDYVLDRLAELVVKPIDGFGGAGITIGPEASRHELLERRRDLLTHPERYVAQEVVPLSTHPTFDGSGLFPHHIDLRAFVHLRAEGPSVRAHVAPAALTRVAPIGSMVVNSSRGGGGKDTWVLGPPRGAGSDE